MNDLQRNRNISNQQSDQSTPSAASLASLYTSEQTAILQTPASVPRKKRLLSHGLLPVLLSVLALLIIGAGLFQWMSRSSPMLQGHSDPMPNSVNLSQEGTLDWAHWGYLATDLSANRFLVGNPIQRDCLYNPHCFNHKANGGSQISDYTPIGNFDHSVYPHRLYARNIPVFFWQDGSPIPIVSDAQTTEFIAGQGNGFQLQVFANQTVHTLKIYVDAYQAQVTCKAVLSDNSAPTYMDTSLNSSDVNIGRLIYYTFTYKAAYPAQILTITFTLAKDFGGGNVALYAATLQ